MSLPTAFLPLGQTVAVVTNATPATSSNATITLYGNGTGFVFNTGATPKPAAQPNQLRIMNAGTAIVFVSFNLLARAAVIPVAGTNQIEYPILPSSVEVFSGIVWAPQGAASPNLIVATISSAASQPLYLTFGEGL